MTYVPAGKTAAAFAPCVICGEALLNPIVAFVRGAAPGPLATPLDTEYVIAHRSCAAALVRGE